MLTVPVPGAPPGQHFREAPSATRIEDPASLRDAELDSWHADLVLRPSALTCGPVHGDYYRRNLLVSRGSIRTILDWDDAHPDFLMQEVA
jgi:Ser/Thr protein kinase RdoA (MazF antagonist)